MLPKVKEAEHNKKEEAKAAKDPEYVVVPYVPPPKPKRGRPSKAALKAAGSKIGRPKETEGRIAEFKERLLATSGMEVINKIVEIAQKDDHPGQMAALKMCMDRILPMSLFDKAAGNKGNIQINITNATEKQSEVEIVEIEASEVDVDDN